MPKYVRILNMHNTLHEVTLKVNDYLLRYVKDLRQRFGKITIAFDYFCKTIHLKSLRGFWYQRVKILIIPGLPIWQGSEFLGFWIFRVTQGLPIFVNMTRFWIGVRMQLWKGSEYYRIPNMPGSACTRVT